MSDEPLVLGIETSCDETGIGIVRGTTLLVDAIASSVEEHARFGGVVPEVASRAHLEAMVPTIQRACETAGVALTDLDGIAVTSGPGLAGALMVGVASAKALALSLGLPLYGVNHLASHVAVDIVEHGPLPEPTMALLVSGGHSSLLLVPDVTSDVRPLGSTIDDAAGEAFDKVARVLGLPFPGGPHIDRAWADGWPGHGAAPFRLLVLGVENCRHAVGHGGAGGRPRHTGRGRGGEFSGGGDRRPDAQGDRRLSGAWCGPPADRWRCRGQLAAARDGPGAVRQGGNPAPRAEAGPVHRQRRHGRRAPTSA